MCGQFKYQDSVITYLYPQQAVPTRHIRASSLGEHAHGQDHHTNGNRTRASPRLPVLLLRLLNPVPLLQLEGQVHLAEVLEAKAAERLNLCLLLCLEH